MTINFVGGFLLRTGFKFTLKVTDSWSLIPGVVWVLMIMEGFEVSMRSRMLPEAIRVGSFTMFCSPKLLVISSSLLCLLAVLLLVVW